jgi:hypothetical protein
VLINNDCLLSGWGYCWVGMIREIWLTKHLATESTGFFAKKAP